MEETGVKRKLTVILAATATAVAACAIQPTDLSLIKVGATRATVESVLGEPVKTTKTDAGTVDIYRYNRGDPEDLLTWQDIRRQPNLVLLAILTAPYWAPVGVPLIEHTKYERQRGEIDITFGPRDTVAAIFPIPPVANSDSLTLVELGTPPAEVRELKTLAEQGDIHAQASLGLSPALGSKRWKWLCLAAHRNHPLAQAAFAEAFAREDRSSFKLTFERDLIKAYLWYSLASSAPPSMGSFKLDLTAKMTPEEIAEAKRRVAAWRPNPESCKTVRAAED